MKRTIGAGMFALVLLAAPMSAGAQTTPDFAVSATSATGVPTTKLMAIGTRTAKGTPDAVKQLLPQEVRETVQLYLAGKIDQWFVKQDQTGVIFILNVTDQDEANTMLAKLPLGRAGLMDFQFIPLGPLSPLGALLTTAKN